MEKAISCLKSEKASTSKRNAIDPENGATAIQLTIKEHSFVLPVILYHFQIIFTLTTWLQSELLLP